MVLEKILEESIVVAKSYIKYNKYYNNNLDELDLHINLLNAGIKKDGSSGGVAIITSILSALKNKVINDVDAPFIYDIKIRRVTTDSNGEIQYVNLYQNKRTKTLHVV